MKADDKVQQFVNDILSVDEEKHDVLIYLQKIILKICPDAQKEIKYGGLVFNVNAVLICGIFIYKKHISLEFSFGNEFADPRKCLDGNGKYRRHLKILNKEDINNKDVEFFVSQAFDC
jgi:hypothetical protein